eukprot:4387194-Amphidinium_carterae.1
MAADLSCLPNCANPCLVKMRVLENAIADKLDRCTNSGDTHHALETHLINPVTAKQNYLANARADEPDR